MFKLIKKLFQVEKEIITHTIHPDKIHKWFAQEAKVVQQKTSEKLTSIKSEYLEKIHSVRDSLKELENAALRNPNIMLREKQFMEGNRKSYLQRSALFLRELEEVAELELNFFLSHYSEYVDNFAKSTQRSYRILQEFFANEVRNIAISIKGVDSVVDKLKNDEEMHSHNQIEHIKKNLVSIENKIKKKDELSIELRKLKTNLKKIKISELQEKREGILDTTEYKNYQALLSKKEELENEINKLKDLVYTTFSPLGRQLKKYQRVAYQHDKLIEHYHTDAFNALITDTHFKIIEILKGLVDNIDVKDKKTEKVKRIALSLDKNFFTDKMRKYSDLKTKLDHVNNELSDCKIGEELNNIDEKIEKEKNDKQLIKKRIEDINNEINSIDILQLRHKIREDMEKVLKVKIDFEE